MGKIVKKEWRKNIVILTDFGRFWIGLQIQNESQDAGLRHSAHDDFFWSWEIRLLFVHLVLLVLHTTIFCFDEI